MITHTSFLYINKGRWRNEESKKMKIIQPSGMVIHADVNYQNDIIKSAVISGKVIANNKEYFIDKMTSN